MHGRTPAAGLGTPSSSVPRRAALRFLRCYSSLAMNLESILFTQGFGSRRQCRALIADARVSIGGVVCTDADADFPTRDGGLHFSVDGVVWPYREHAYVLLNK